MASRTDPPEPLEVLDERDRLTVAAYIADEATRRQSARRKSGLEAQWDEIDRQVKMKYDPPWIDERGRRTAPGTEWLPQLEVPWQAETLELLTTDLDRMVFPATGNHFEVEADDPEKVLEAIERGAFRTDQVPGAANVDLVNMIVEAVHEHYQRRTAQRGQWRRMWMNAFKYGTMVGRQRLGRFAPFQWDDAWDGDPDQPIPLLTYMPVRNVLLDADAFSAMRMGEAVAPGQIYSYGARLTDLRAAAKLGSSDPTRFDGGWIPEGLRGIEGKTANGDVELLEFEGDLVCERSTADAPIWLQNAIVTAVKGTDGQGKSKSGIIRLRLLNKTARSYLYSPYFVDSDDIEGVYGTCPLMKGRPIQKTASETLNRFMQSAILNTEPPIGYDPTDPILQGRGGPRIEPRALWPSSLPLTIHQIGDPAALIQAFAAIKVEYNDVTGTQAPRLGQQTKSHQTAFAIDTELVRGLSRTVSFGQWITGELIPRQLHLEYRLIRENMPADGLRVYVRKLRRWFTVTKAMLPERVSYSVAGAADPLVEQQKVQQKMQALQMLVAADQAEKSVTPDSQPINWKAIKADILREGGFNDVDRILQPAGPTLRDFAGAAAGLPAESAGDAGVPGSPEAVPTESAIRLAAGRGAPGPGA